MKERSLDLFLSFQTQSIGVSGRALTSINSSTILAQVLASAMFGSSIVIIIIVIFITIIRSQFGS